MACSYTVDTQGVYQVTGITIGIGAEAQSLTLDYGNSDTALTECLGDVMQYQKEASGNLVEVVAPAVDGASLPTWYGYDANGNLLTSTAPQRHGDQLPVRRGRQRGAASDSYDGHVYGQSLASLAVCGYVPKCATGVLRAPV